MSNTSGGKIHYADLNKWEIFKAIDVFTAPRFTATGAWPDAKRTRILSMTQHA
jgi:hypothetical protein